MWPLAKNLPLSGVFAILVAPAGAQTIESVYTDLDVNKCRHTPGTAEEDYGVWHCKGYAGIPVRVSAGDQRTQVSYGKNAAKQLAARTTFAKFNSEGSKIEWRIEKHADGKKVAFATILPWNIIYSNDNGDPVRGQIFVVTRLGESVCHVGYADGQANKNADELARRIADEHARNFDCKKDKPVVLGEKGPGFSEASSWDEK
jgi:hypothetical protein